MKMEILYFTSNFTSNKFNNFKDKNRVLNFYFIGHPR